MAPPTRPTSLPRWARTAAGAAAANIVVPASGQLDTGWTPGQIGVSSYDNWRAQLIYDWLAQLGIALPSGVLSAVDFGPSGGNPSESFESATFPPVDPVGAWSAPSSRIGTLAYARDTSTPISGTASANRPAGQGTNTTSSLGLDFYAPAPFRIAFSFNVICNPNSDFFSAELNRGKSWAQTLLKVSSTGTSGSPVAAKGLFLSAPIPPGKHTLDFSFARAALSAVTGEAAKLDDVMIIPESQWLDRTSKILFEDDFHGYSGGLVANGPWTLSNSGNAGSASGQILAGVAGVPTGMLGVQSAAIAANDWEALSLGLSAAQFGGGVFQRLPYLEAWIVPDQLANIFFEVGLWDGTTNNLVAWLYDTLLGTTLRLRSTSGGVSTTVDTGITPSGFMDSLALQFSSYGLVGMYNKAAQAAAGVFGVTVNTNLPSVQLQPYVRVGSRTAAGARKLYLDYFKYLGLRQ
jgi:hypothetical protein